MQTQIPKGFTLVELSIVLIIIGLIVSGVVAGKSLIENAQLRKVTSKVDYYRSAVNTFILKYDAIPGDVSNAYDYWGSNCDATPSNCNGNDDGRILYGDGGGGADDDNEGIRFWQHLSLAGIIPGIYTGIGGSPGTYLCLPSVNHPELIKDIGIGIGGLINPVFKTYHVGISWSNCWGAAFTPLESYSIDVKNDDGKPDSGRIQSRNGGGGTNNCLSGSNYLTSIVSDECYMLFDH